jgi:hypothetical protein
MIKFIFVFILLFVLYTKPVYAIIVIIPAALVPIVSIVVWVITAISAPIVGLSVLYSKTKKKSIWKAIFVSLVAIFIIAIMLGLILKVINPQRPVY